VSIPYQLSNWDKHFIYVTIESQNILKAAQKASNALHLRRLEVMINDVQAELRESKDVDEQLILIQKQKSLIEAKMEFSKRLGRVILK
jgi:predicted SpoU family rRNA methylase